MIQALYRAADDGVVGFALVGGSLPIARRRASSPDFQSMPRSSRSRRAARRSRRRRGVRWRFALAAVLTVVLMIAVVALLMWLPLV